MNKQRRAVLCATSQEYDLDVNLLQDEQGITGEVKSLTGEQLEVGDQDLLAIITSVANNDGLQVAQSLLESRGFTCQKP